MPGVPVSIPAVYAQQERFGLPAIPRLRTTNTAAQNGAALARAVASANANGGHVLIPDGRYPMKCTLTTGATIMFSPNAVLLQSVNDYALSIDLSGDAVGPYTISAFSYAEHDNGAGASTNKFMRLTVTPTQAADFAVGDSVMVCSRDARTYYTTNTNYAGEMATVADVDAASGYIYLDGALWLHGVGTLYTTNPVVYRLSRQKVRLIRPQVEANGDVYDTSLTGTWPGAIEMKAVARPSVEMLRINSAWAVGLYMKSCALAFVSLDRVNDCPGDPGDNRYGYGVLFRGACNAPTVVGGFSERTRHVVTTDCREAAAWAVGNVWDHGDVTDMTVMGVTSVSNGAAVFDTHENSINATFTNCKAIGGRYSPLDITASNANGFNLRGPYDKVINCEVVDCEGGVNVEATSIIHEIVGENVIDGLTYVNEATNNLSSYAITVAGNASETTPQRVSIRNLRPGRGSRGVLIENGFVGRVLVDNCVFRGFIDTQVRIQGSCTMDVVSSFIDMTEAGTGELCFSIDNSNTVALNLVNVTLRSKNGTTPTNVVTTASGATCALRHYGVVDIAGNIAAGAIEGGAGTYNPAVVGMTALTA